MGAGFVKPLIGSLLLLNTQRNISDIFKTEKIYKVPGFKLLEIYVHLTLYLFEYEFFFVTDTHFSWSCFGQFFEKISDVVRF